VGQTKTTWGTIWDALPAGFPRYPGAEPTQAREGPASATLDLKADPKTAANWWGAALTGAGYATDATEGPLEDGSLVVHSVGQGQCRVQASFVPLGGSTVETVLFAAACPFR